MEPGLRVFLKRYSVKQNRRRTVGTCKNSDTVHERLFQTGSEVLNYYPNTYVLQIRAQNYNTSLQIRMT